MVNIVASRMILNLKAYAASKRPGRYSGASAALPSLAFVSYPSIHLNRYPRPRPSESAESEIDLELYAIEREYQQLGSRLR